MHDTASMLSHSHEPFLAISFNYRLGALGFLNSSFTASHGLLNLGLHDQVLLLDWVQANAAAFGGDREMVTLIGLSAGAHSIGHHILNVNEKRQLFHRAVMESGAATSRATHTSNSELHEAQFKKFLSRLSLLPDTPDLLQQLRAAPIDKLTAAQNAVFAEYNPSVRWAWQPVIDDEIISRVPLEAWKSSAEDYHNVPILTGFNHNEGSRYVPRGLDTSLEFRQFFATLLPQLSEAQLDRLEGLYPDPQKHPTAADSRDCKRLGIGRQYARVEKAYGHYAYVSPVRETARFNKNKTWLYHWDVLGDEVFGANHADQMWYEMMAASVRKRSETHEEIAKVFNGFLTRFVVRGDPGEGWRAFVEAGETMVFGRGNDEAVGGTQKGSVSLLEVDGWGEEECKFWAEVKEMGDL
jgi:triacylglycerol lipase